MASETAFRALAKMSEYPLVERNGLHWVHPEAQKAYAEYESITEQDELRDEVKRLRGEVDSLKRHRSEDSDS